MNREYFVYAEEDPMKDLYVGWNERERERGGRGREDGREEALCFFNDIFPALPRYRDICIK